MKKSILTILLFSSFLFSFSKFIDENSAKTVGLHFLKNNSSKNATVLTLAYTIRSKANDATSFSETTPYIYVFNTNSKGFVLVSADDNVVPILGYSDEETIDINNIAPQTSKWLESYKNQIRDIISKGIPATDEIRNEWQSLLSSSTVNTSLRGSSSVSPLIQTKWNQSPYYNALCPDNSVSGCVATAMTQIMKFWNYPANGSGFHSYNHDRYGTLSADFGSTTYQWSSMPNIVNSPNSAVATLTYQVGVSVNMNYSPQSSGAYVITNSPTPQACSEYALKTYFGYKSTLRGIERVNYNETQWMSTIKSELDAGRPVLYAGFGSGGGHCFVADGYDNNNYIHFNWGWAGAYDGFFYINALNPDGIGTGGGTGSYNSGHQAVIGIEPNGSTSTQNFDLKMYSNINMPSTQIWFRSAFSLSADIANLGTNSFSGQLGAAIFNSNYKFVDFMEIKSTSIQNGFYQSVTFNNAGSAAFVPGTYYAQLFYKTATQDWKVIGNGSYSNWQQFKINYSSDIETNSVFTITNNSGKLIKGQSATVNVDVINKNNTTFFGKLRVNLSKLDGTLAQNIQILNENNGLPYNYHYTGGNNFAGIITVDPGTYLMEVAYQTQGSSSWYYAGSSNYSNPVYVIVEGPSYQPDQYENNNTAATAYTLPISFSGNNASKNTVGSNCHVSTDYDYYKLVLPSGFNYTISPRLHDSYNSGNGNIYSVDGLFSYSTNGGSSWSDAFDDVMTGNIAVNNGGTVIFQVSPYFAGEIGTYLLDMSISRSVVSGLKENLNSDNITVFPNPAKDYVTIDFNKLNSTINNIVLYTIDGQQVGFFNEIKSNEVLQIPLQNLANGAYLLHIDTKDGLLIKKIIIEK
ncbi:MAG TPA: thiol protease/hemagglutinin PrtT [Chitinophagales bacterium]|nr:thiol protease/hemagglutinin PrtT [Chitinophagales bacterium]